MRCVVAVNTTQPCLMLSGSKAHLYWRSHSFGQDPNLKTVGEGLNAGLLISYGLCPQDPSFQTPHLLSILKAMHWNIVKLKLRKILQLHGLFLTKTKVSNKPPCWSSLESRSSGPKVAFVQSGAATECLHGCRRWKPVLVKCPMPLCKMKHFFSHLYQRCHSFGQHPKLMTTGEGWSVGRT